MIQVILIKCDLYENFFKYMPVIIVNFISQNLAQFENL
jgi:hypothetical protein